MVRLIGLFRRKEGISFAEFRDYYENDHAPLAESHFGHLFCGYTRSYVDHGDGWLRLGRTGSEGIDVVTEIRFPDEAAMEQMFAMTTADPQLRETIAADEAAFMDRDATRLVIVREHTESDLGRGPPREHCMMVDGQSRTMSTRRRLP